MPKMLIINTGGTIDAEAYGAVAPEFTIQATPSNVEAYLKTLMPQAKYIGWPKMGDSKTFNKHDYKAIAEAINKSDADKILLVHGTDRMAKLGRFLKRHVNPGKTVLITGGMVPLANGPESDGFANLEDCITRLSYNAAPKGVSVVFNNGIFNPDAMRKNYAEKRFEHAGLKHAAHLPQFKGSVAVPLLSGFGR